MIKRRTQLQAALMVALFIISTAAQDVYRQFAVVNDPLEDSKHAHGSCRSLPKDVDLQALYREAIDMARIVVTSLKRYTEDQTVRASVITFFGINETADPDSHEVNEAQKRDFDFMFDTFQGMIDFAGTEARDNLPSLFCDDTWLQKTTIYHDETTGRPTSSTVRQATNNKIDYLYWSPRFKKNLGPKNEGCQPERTGAYTLPGPMKSITLCPFMFEKHATLSVYRPRSTPLEPLSFFSSQPSIMLHELSHLLERDITDIKFDAPGHKYDKEKAYGTNRVVALARQSSALAVLNADSYTWFAIAMFLPQWDWSRIIGGANQVALNPEASLKHPLENPEPDPRDQKKPRLDPAFNPPKVKARRSSVRYVAGEDGWRRRSYINRVGASEHHLVDGNVLHKASRLGVAH